MKNKKIEIEVVSTVEVTKIYKISKKKFERNYFGDHELFRDAKFKRGIRNALRVLFKPDKVDFDNSKVFIRDDETERN